ncbi:MAG: hypothetical protein ACYTHK_12460 [Planctomycetota bacterium]
MILLLIALPARAADPEAEVKKLEAKATARVEKVKGFWSKFVEDRDTCSDDELRALIESYDTAIDLCHEVSELKDSPSANSKILLLARRTATLRATLFMREMRRKAAAGANGPGRPEEVDPPGGAIPAAAEKDPRESARAKSAVELLGLKEVPLPIAESDKERAANIRRLRKFLFEYFRHMKPRNIRRLCRKCDGTGRRKHSRVVDGRKMDYTLPCKACAERGGSLNKDHARRALWLTRTPLSRQDPTVRKWFDEWIARYEAKVSEIEPVSRLVIKKIEYHGLWAKVTWQETRRKEKQTKERLFVRLGRRWYFYDPAHDKEILTVSAEDQD